MPDGRLFPLNARVGKVPTPGSVVYQRPTSKDRQDIGRFCRNTLSETDRICWQSAPKDLSIASPRLMRRWRRSGSLDVYIWTAIVKIGFVGHLLLRLSISCTNLSSAFLHWLRLPFDQVILVNNNFVLI